MPHHPECRVISTCWSEPCPVGSDEVTELVAFCVKHSWTACPASHETVQQILSRCFKSACPTAPQKLISLLLYPRTYPAACQILTRINREFHPCSPIGKTSWTPLKTSGSLVPHAYCGTSSNNCVQVHSVKPTSSCCRAPHPWLFLISNSVWIRGAIDAIREWGPFGGRRCNTIEVNPVTKGTKNQLFLTAARYNHHGCHGEVFLRS